MFARSKSPALLLAALVLSSTFSRGAEPRQADTTGSTGIGSAPEVKRRTLNRREGTALRDFALAQPADTEPKPDCSHLMHEIFTAAGLDYPYANSFEIYSGIPQFRPVRSPQPGDLIVWRGHVGMVIDPGGHSFYSSLGSGIQTDEYDNTYWRRRGRPRFYRYLARASDKVETLIASARAAQRPYLAAPAQPSPQPEITEAAAAVETAVNPAGADSDAENFTAEPFRMPASIQIVASGTSPTTAEVAAGISELANASGSLLRRTRLAQLSSSVVIYDQLRVEKVKVKRDSGWADVRIRSRIELDQQRVKNSLRSEKRRWELRRDGQGWVAIPPSDRVYVPSDVSVQVLAEKLAVLSRDRDHEREEQARLAKLLDSILNQN